MSTPGTGQPPSLPEPGGARAVAGLAALLLVVVLVVGGAWRYTRHAIADNADRGVLTEIAAVLPAGLYDNSPARDLVQIDTGGGQPVPVYRARRNGRPVAAAVTIVAPDGYAGPIRLLVGISTDGRVLGARVQAHTETPGIGAAVAADNSPVLAGLVGRSLADPPEARWTVRNDGGEFDAIAGATVSSRAVIGGVRRAVQFFTTHQDEIFALPTAVARR